MEFDFLNSLFAAVALEEEGITRYFSSFSSGYKEIMRPRSVISSNLRSRRHNCFLTGILHGVKLDLPVTERAVARGVLCSFVIFSGAWSGGFAYYRRSCRGPALTGHKMARTKALILHLSRP